MRLFKERYRHELDNVLRFFGVTRVCETSVEFKHGYISFGKKWPEFQMDHTYEEGIPRLCFCIVWMAVHIDMPFLKQRYPDVNHSPAYGFIVHDSSLWWHWGLNTYCFYMPWSWDIYRSDVKDVNGSWVKNEILSEAAYKEYFPYKYTRTSGEVQAVTATVYEEYREWRWKWFMYTPAPRRVRRSIAVSFSEEVGESTGSWKGGTVGCGYDMKRGETMLHCLRRMEAERKF